MLSLLLVGNARVVGKRRGREREESARIRFLSGSPPPKKHQLSQNSLLVYRRTWLIAWAATEVLVLETVLPALWSAAKMDSFNAPRF